MTLISRRRDLMLIALITALIGVVATSVFGQEKAGKEKTKAEYKAKNKTFCGQDNWSDGDRASVRDLREVTIPAVSRLSVDANQNGGISVKGDDRNDILIRACVQAWGSTDEAAKATAASVTIGTSELVRAGSPAGDKNWSVSYQILVPRTTNLDLKAHNGGISISGVNATAEFETQNGGVHLTEVAGDIKGRTTNGGVNITLAGSTWRGTGLDVTTTNGGVHIAMPANYAARIESGTVNGGFSSNIAGLDPGRSSRDYHSRSTKISTDINGGGAPIRIMTTNGGVKINSIDD